MLKSIGVARTGAGIMLNITHLRRQIEMEKVDIRHQLLQIHLTRDMFRVVPIRPLLVPILIHQQRSLLILTIIFTVVVRGVASTLVWHRQYLTLKTPDTIHHILLHQTLLTARTHNTIHLPPCIAQTHFLLRDMGNR
jgi:hypothetical protein